MKSEVYQMIKKDNQQIITFLDGIPGFYDKKEFILLYSEEGSPFIIMQSAEEDNLFFVTISPWEIIKDYRFEISDSIKAKLKIDSDEDILVLSICNIRDKLKNMTVNLAAPIIINYKKRLGKQLVLDNTDYKVRYPVFTDQTKLGVSKCLS